MSEIRLEGIRKSFGERTIIRDLHLTIRDGEFFTFVGPSGCGKSTLLNVIAGLEEASQGRVWFDGVDVTPLSPRERDVAMVFQSYALYPHMTVFENIAFPLRMRKERSETVNNEVEKMVSLLGLEDLTKRKPAELSGGQRQRVALARALVRKPKVFLLDEPLSNLDARLRMTMRAEIKRLQRELRVTAIFVTHDQGEAMNLSDRMAVFNEGTVQQCGPPLEIYREPANTFVGVFVGSPPMNLVEAIVAGTEPFKVDCNSLAMAPKTRERPAVREGDRILAGIRPEDMTVSRGEEGETGKAKVLLVEPAGSLDWVDVQWGHFAVRGNASAGSRLEPGDAVHLKPAEDRVVLFDKTSGKRIG
ncbi:MAG: ABC transporter ATP-binding protein [Thermodesulfobacteriota bacterium]